MYLMLPALLNKDAVDFLDKTWFKDEQPLISVQENINFPQP